MTSFEMTSLLVAVVASLCLITVLPKSAIDDLNIAITKEAEKALKDSISTNCEQDTYKLKQANKTPIVEGLQFDLTFESEKCGELKNQKQECLVTVFDKRWTSEDIYASKPVCKEVKA